MSNWILYKKAMKGSHHWKETCFLCNQWILKDEEFYMIGIPDEIRKQYDIKNFIVHKEEWEKFIERLSDEEVAAKVLNHKKPKKKPLTKEQLENIEYFKRSVLDYGYNKITISRDKRFVKAKKRKTSFMFIYDIIFDRITYDCNYNEGLFGGLFSNEAVAKVRNKFNEYRGLDKHDNYTAEGVIKEAINQINEIMK